MIHTDGKPTIAMRAGDALQKGLLVDFVEAVAELDREIEAYLAFLDEVKKGEES